jgi:hypothetical protein
MSLVFSISSAGMAPLTNSLMSVSTNPGPNATDFTPAALSSLFIASV